MSNFSLFNFFFFQTTAMALFAYIVQLTGGFLNDTNSIICFLGMFGCLAWCGRFTGTALNPAIVLALILQKTNSLPIRRGLFLMLMEFLGAFIGTIIGDTLAEIPVQAQFMGFYTLQELFRLFAKEILGTFLYTMILLILITPDTTFAQIDLQVWFTMPIILMTVCVFNGLAIGVNPSLGIAFQIWYCYKNQTFTLMQYTWVLFLGPFVGSFLASLFFQFMYRRMARIHKEDLEHQDKMMRKRLNNLKDQIDFVKRVSVLELV